MPRIIFCLDFSTSSIRCSEATMTSAEAKVEHRGEGDGVGNRLVSEQSQLEKRVLCFLNLLEPRDAL